MPSRDPISNVKDQQDAEANKQEQKSVSLAWQVNRGVYVKTNDLSDWKRKAAQSRPTESKGHYEDATETAIVVLSYEESLTSQVKELF